MRIFKYRPIFLPFFILLLGVFVFSGCKKSTTQSSTNSQQQESQQTQQQVQVPAQTGNRQHGNSQIKNSVIDTPTYDDTKVESVIGRTGGVLTLTLKNGAHVYLVIPPGAMNNSNLSQPQNLSLAEYKAMPTTAAALPLASDLGYGVEVGFSAQQWDLEHPVFLVWDFSGGKKLQDFQKFNTGKKGDQSNHCDYSRASFQPELCAAQLGIPADKTLNTKYFAADPRFAEESHRAPVFIDYSYYIGTDDVLVSRVANSVSLVPQYAAQDELTELIKNSFSNFGGVNPQQMEALDWARNLQMTDFDMDFFSGSLSTALYYENFKALAARNYFVDVLNTKIKNSTSDDEKQSLQNVLNGVVNFSNDQPGKLLTEWSKNASAEPSDYLSVVAAGNLRRAYESNIHGAKDQLLASINTLHDQLTAQKSFPQFDDQEVYEYEAVWTLAGKKRYQVSAPVSSPQTAFHMIPFAYATGDSGQTQSQIDQQINDITNAAEKRINDTISNPDATLGDLLNALAIAQTIGDKEAENILMDLIQKDVQREMKTAITDQEKIDAYKHCEVLISDPADCDHLRHDVQDIIVKMCQGKVVAKNLKNFGNQLLESCKNFGPD